MAYDQVLLLNASERATEGYERIEKKLTKIRKILEAEIAEKKRNGHGSNGNSNGNGKIH